MMKKTTHLFYCNETINQQYLKTNQNNLISFDHEKNSYYFRSHYAEYPEPINIKKIHFKPKLIDKDFYNYMRFGIKPSLNQAKTISEEEIDCEKNFEEKLFQPISAVLYRFQNELGTKKHDIFNLFTNLFITLLSGHYINNGNKRFAFCYLIFVTYSFGYYFKFTQTDDGKNYVKHKQQILNFTLEAQQKTKIRKNIYCQNSDLGKNIKNGIYSNTVVALNGINPINKKIINLNGDINRSYLVKILNEDYIQSLEKRVFNHKDSKVLKEIIYALREH